MRIWDIDVKDLCDKHLIAQHYEIHCIYGFRTKNLSRLSNHPEIGRWIGHLDALISKHNETVEEMKFRNINHHTPIVGFHMDSPMMPDSWQSVEHQKNLLISKGCKCKVGV